MAPDCLVCREIAGDVPVPGGLLWSEELAVAFHVPPLPDRGDPYLGHLLVVTRRHAAGLADLTEAEGEAVGRGAVRLASALVAAGATQVHSGVAGAHAAHFHLHLLPRYEDTPPEVPWHAVNDWPGARHGGVIELEALADRLRSATTGSGTHDACLTPNVADLSPSVADRPQHQ